jgi:hypothetical protein
MQIYIEKLQSLTKHIADGIAEKDWEKVVENSALVSTTCYDIECEARDMLAAESLSKFVAKHGIETGDTVIGYLFKYRPEKLIQMNDVVRETVGYGRKASQLCKLHGLSPVTVQAPEGLQEYGIDHVRVYPLHILEAVC